MAMAQLNNPTLFKTTIETQTGRINAEEEFSAHVVDRKWTGHHSNVQYMYPFGL